MELDRVYKWSAPIKFYCENRIQELMETDNILPYFGANIDNTISYSFDIERRNLIVTGDLSYWGKLNAFVIDTAEKAIKWRNSDAKILIIDMLAKDKDLPVIRFFKTAKFMRLILDGIEANIEACVIYRINFDEPSYIFDCADIWGSYPKVYINGRNRTIRDKISYFSATRRYSRMFGGEDIPDDIKTCKYYTKECRHFSDTNECCGLGVAIKIDLIDGYNLLEDILVGSSVEYKISNPTGKKDIMPIHRKYIIICRNKTFANYVASLCKKYNLSVSFDKISRETKADVKIITNMNMLNRANWNIYSHIVFIACKKILYMRVIREILNLFRVFNVYLHIV